MANLVASLAAWRASSKVVATQLSYRGRRTVLAYDYPLLGMFWTLLWFFLWVAWIIILFRVFIDIFRSHDLGGWGKALWSIFVLIVPFLGVFIYLIARGHGMQERDIKEAQAKEQAFRSYVQDAATTSGGRHRRRARQAG